MVGAGPPLDARGEGPGGEQPFATVSPQNQYSLHNALASGFAIVSRREMYGGHDRYLLAKEL